MSHQPSGSDEGITRFQVRASTLQFLGAPEGEGVGLLEEELRFILADEGNTRRAYLSRLQHPGEDRIRLALLIDGTQPAEQMAPPIARECAELISSLDLLFFQRLTDEQVRHVEQSLTPFYVAKDA